MAKQFSYRSQEREIEPRYRTMIDSAESTEDVRKFFERTAADFLDRAIGEEIGVDGRVVIFTPESDKPFTITPELANDEKFNRIIEQSDLTHILKSLSDRAVNRYMHLDRKQPAKTESKVRRKLGNR